MLYAENKEMPLYYAQTIFRLQKGTENEVLRKTTNELFLPMISYIFSRLDSYEPRIVDNLSRFLASYIVSNKFEFSWEM